MPLPVRQASITAWNDDPHASAHRTLYRERFNAVLPLLSTAMHCQQPSGGFYIWAQTPGNDLDFAARLYRDFHVRVLPGRLLSQPDDDHGPGAGRVRIALVADTDRCITAAKRILRCLQIH